MADLIAELLASGRPRDELARVVGVRPDDLDAWGAGRGEPSFEQIARVVAWRDALREGLEAASGRDARRRLPSALWRAGRDRLGGPTLPLATRNAWSLESRIATEQRRLAVAAELAELLALAAASPNGHEAVSAELIDLADDLRLRAAGWRLTADMVRAAAALIVGTLSATGESPTTVRALVHDTVRWVDIVVGWPVGAAPALTVELGLATEIADALGVAADGVSVRWDEELGAEERAEIEEHGFDLLAVADGATEAGGGASPASPADAVPTSAANPRPGEGAPARPPRLSVAELEAALRRFAPVLPWALRVDMIAPTAAWAWVREGTPVVEVVAQWDSHDSVPTGWDERLRRSVAASLGVPPALVHIYTASDLPLDEVVALSQRGVRLVPAVEAPSTEADA